jgi:hypothetical protein
MQDALACETSTGEGKSKWLSTSDVELHITGQTIAASVFSSLCDRLGCPHLAV